MQRIFVNAKMSKEYIVNSVYLILFQAIKNCENEVDIALA